MIGLVKHFAASLAICAALIPIPALSSLIAPTGKVQCAQGEYVVGLSGRTGAWIDAVGPICARQFGPQHARPLVGGAGGGLNQKSCHAGSAVSRWLVDYVKRGDADAAVADRVWVECVTLSPPHRSTSAVFLLEGQNNLSRGGRIEGQCARGDLATGLTVWTTLDGAYVTRIEMDCAPAPKESSIPTLKPTDPVSPNIRIPSRP